MKPFCEMLAESIMHCHSERKREEEEARAFHESFRKKREEKKFDITESSPEEYVLEALAYSSRYISAVPDRLKDDEAFAKKALKANITVYAYLSDRLRDNEELALIAVSGFGDNLEYASDRLRENRKIAEAAVKESPLAIRFSGTLGNDRDAAADAIRANGEAYCFISDKFTGDRELFMTAICTWGSCRMIGPLDVVPDVLRKDKEVCLLMMSSIYCDSWYLADAAKNFADDDDLIFRFMILRFFLQRDGINEVWEKLNVTGGAAERMTAVLKMLGAEGESIEELLAFFPFNEKICVSPETAADIIDKEPCIWFLPFLVPDTLSDGRVREAIVKAEPDMAGFNFGNM